MIKKYSIVLFVFFSTFVSSFGQTTVCFDFTTGFSNGTTFTNESLDANIRFTTYQNDGTANTRIWNNQLRCYQDATKGGGFIIDALNGVTITDVVINASGTTGPAEYVIDSGTANSLAANTTYNITSILATTDVEFYQKDGSDTNRIFIDDFCVTYTSTTTPTITVSETAITNLNYIVGSGPSASQSFDVQATNLTTDVALNAPTNFEIATAIGGPYSSNINLSHSGGTVPATTIYTRLVAGLSINTYNGSILASSVGAATQTVSLEGVVTGSNNSDIIKVTSSEATTISATINDVAPLTVSEGVQVWQFKVRDGGATLNDADNLPTILTSFTLLKNAGSSIANWSDAIETIALFDGSTNLAEGAVSANQIQFNSLNISTADNTEKTLSLRLSLKCPIDAGALDNEDFVFSLSNANVTFSNTGSGKSGFSAQISTNDLNAINVTATQLQFTTQPTTTGLNAAMSDVVVTATDACGNTDTNFTGSVTITSSGSMTGNPISVNAVSGVATFTNIIHTALGTNLTMSTTSTGLTSASSNLFDITDVTTLEQGDLAILAVNTNTQYHSGSQSGQDEISFVCFKDITAGTTFYITDNGYEREYANEWGGTEGVLTITRTGGTLPRGTIITIQVTKEGGNVYGGSDFEIYTCGAIDSNWFKDALSGGSIGGFNLNSDDDMWIMQGGTWTNSTSHHSTYTGGNVLYGWTESGWQNTPGGGSQSTRWSTIYPGLECYNTVAPVGDGFVKFNDPINPDFSTTTNGRFDWIALINNTANWDTYANNSDYASNGYDYIGNTSCASLIIAGNTYVDGKWTGKEDTDWFNCSNWDTLKVPDQTVNVQVGDNIYNHHAKVDITSTYAAYYNNIARARNLTISGEKVEVSSSPNNKLEIHGDLLIDASGGALDMNDNNDSTNDGEITLYGNWTNNQDNNAFDEGNGTIIFAGNTDQIINNVTPRNTEEFFNVTLNNNFNTSISNSLYLNGSLLVNTGETVTIDTNDYVRAYKDVTNNGIINIENSGSLIQIDDNGIASGNINMKRTASIKSLDYVYWASPVVDYLVNNIWATNRIYKWGPTAINANGTEGNWVNATGNNMVKGLGYILRAPNTTGTTPENYTTNFTGVPQNGIIEVAVARGTNITGTDFNDDNWNLIGNPYPSGISADALLLDHAVNASIIKGWIKLWTHGDPPGAFVDPFYQDFTNNYDVQDYITYNYLGPSMGPDTFSGYIAAGQAFFVNMVDGAADNTQKIAFKNAYREKNINYNNNEFFRTSNYRNTTEKNRIWLDLINETNGKSNRILIGYTAQSTLAKDTLYDAENLESTSQNFYSIIQNKPFVIQARGAFNENDVVPLGIRIPTNGNYYIAIPVVDGLFETQNQTIYLKDNALNFTHNLSNNPYSFTANAGTIDNRFQIVYKNNTLSVNEEHTTNNHLNIIELQNDNIKFTLTNNSLKIKNVKIYDTLGRLIYNLEGNNSSETYNLSNLSQAAYIAKVTLSNNNIITKKVIKRN